MLTSLFFLKESNQDIMRNSSLQYRVEPFFIYRAKSPPVLNVSYGNISKELVIPFELLQQQTINSFNSFSGFEFNWKIVSRIIEENIYFSKPKVQTLFYIAGKDWSDFDGMEELPCIKMFAILDTRELQASCRLQGMHGLCVAQLELPLNWFNSPLEYQNIGDSSKGIPVELYYMVQPETEGDCVTESGRQERIHSQVMGQEAEDAAQPLQRIGIIFLHFSTETPKQVQLRLDKNIVIYYPVKPVWQGDDITFHINMPRNATVNQFTLRMKADQGMNIISMKVNDNSQWDMQPEIDNGEKHSAAAVICVRQGPALENGADGALHEILQVDVKVEDISTLNNTHSISWQVEYTGQGIEGSVVTSEIFVSQSKPVGIVPIAMETEILNTAILTGKMVAVSVKVIAVEEDGKVTIVSDPTECSSTDDNVIKVSKTCDSVYVDGKEMKSKANITVNFSYLHLSTSLEMTVWAPRLPLQIDVSDTELSQIKGWRVPVTSYKRPTREADEDDEDDRRAKGCSLQYQHAVVRVLTHIVAEASDRGGQLSYLLGPDWQFDITDLVKDFMTVEEPRIAKLQDGRVLIGRETGMTTIQVLSPLSYSILAEKTITVVDERVTITDLGIQLVADLSLSLQMSAGENKAIIAKASASELLYTSKQEALISAWIHLSDGSVTPLDIYDPRHFSFTATSMDEAVVSTYQDFPFKWPTVVAESEGQGPLIKVEMVISESCQKSNRKSILSVGSGITKVKFGQKDSEHKGSGSDNRSVERYPGQKVKEHDKSGQRSSYGGTSFVDNAGGANKSTTKSTMSTASDSGNFPGKNTHIPNIPTQSAGLPRQFDLPIDTIANDQKQSSRGLTDLEIGMYALLGVFCLAILVFLINCATFTLKYKHKRFAVAEHDTMNHSHDWVWLGNEVELLENPVGTSPHQVECTTITDRGLSFEKNNYLLNGKTERNAQCFISRPECNCGKECKSDLVNSPTTKKKRVKFTSFTTILPEDGGPYTNSALLGRGDDNIKWVCQGVKLSDSKELRDYMDRVQDNL